MSVGRDKYFDVGCLSVVEVNLDFVGSTGSHIDFHEEWLELGKRPIQLVFHLSPMKLA